MVYTQRLRKFMLTAHITFSVGWIGAIAVFLVLAITGFVSRDEMVIRASYVAMELSAWLIIAPASLGALTTGILQATGTPWGLFKHYWIIVKLLLTVVCTALLLLHMGPISEIARIASDQTLTTNEFNGLRIRLIADAAVAIGVLLFITTISVYKPWGKTSYGLKKSTTKLKSMKEISNKAKPWGKYILILLISVFVIFIIMHLLGGGMGHH